MSDVDQPALFEVDVPAVRPSKKRPAPNKKARYAKYVVKNPVKCDACMRYLAEMEGSGPVARMARVKRTVGGEPGFMLLCPAHAEALRRYDEAK